MALLSYEVRERIKRLTGLPSWSTLRDLGQSRLLALTALVPFLGSLILFNQHLVDLLTLSASYLGRFAPPQDTAEFAASRAATMTRLYFTCFGLSFIGTAAFLFIVSCPSMIKRYDVVQDYLTAETPLQTTARLRLLVTEITVTYCRHEVDRDVGFSWLHAAAYPHQLLLLYIEAFEDIFRRIDVDFVEHIEGVFSATGNLGVDVLSEAVATARRIHRPFVEAFMTAAGQQPLTDLLTIQYMGQDFSRPGLRVAITLCYGLGFGILLIPTVWTFVQILARLFGV